MSDYVPPENPYDSPQEEGRPPDTQSRPWLFVLIAIVAVLVLGACGCGVPLLFFYAKTSVRTSSQAPSVVIEVEPADAADDSSRQVSPDGD